MVWQIEFADSALKQLKKLDKHVANKILTFLEKKVATLEDPKSAGKPLSGHLATFWRYRVGDFRIICNLDSKSITVLVLKVSHRSKVYDNEVEFVQKASEEMKASKERRKIEDE